MSTPWSDPNHDALADLRSAVHDAPAAYDRMRSTTTVTLTEFLLARIAEDEAVAQAAGGVAWIATPSTHDLHQRHEAHIARFDPARMLAECQSKWTLVYDAIDVPTISLRHTLRILASVYADHPDYRQEWAS